MKWILNELVKRDKDAFEKCMWYSQLIMLELQPYLQIVVRRESPHGF